MPELLLLVKNIVKGWDQVMKEEEKVGPPTTSSGNELLILAVLMNNPNVSRNNSFSNRKS